MDDEQSNKIVNEMTLLEAKITQIINDMKFLFEIMVGLQGTPRPKEEAQHGNQMEIQFLTRVPMIMKAPPLT